MSLSWLASRRLWGAAIGVGLFLALLLLPALSGLNPAAQRTAAVAALMAAFWIGEVIPIYATPLFPIVLFPLLGILDTKAVTAPYADRVVFLMMGGFIIAEAMKKWWLHRRIALHIIRRIGGPPPRVIPGLLHRTPPPGGHAAQRHLRRPGQGPLSPRARSLLQRVDQARLAPQPGHAALGLAPPPPDHVPGRRRWNPPGARPDPGGAEQARAHEPGRGFRAHRLRRHRPALDHPRT